MTSRRRQKALAAGGGIYIAAVWLFNVWAGNRPVLGALSTFAEMVIPVAVAVVTWRTGRRLGAVGWYLFAIGAGLWCLGETTWTILELAGHALPFPSIADIFYVAESIFMVAAAFRIVFRPLSLREQVRNALDGLLIGLALLYLAWSTVYRSPAGSAHEAFTRLLSLHYPIIDALIVTLFIATLLSRRAPRHMGSLLVAFTSMLVADSLFAYTTHVGTYETWFLPDLAWMIGFAAIGVAALIANSAESSDALYVGYETSVVYTAFFVPVFTALIRVVFHGELSRVDATLLVGMALVSILRQGSVYLENIELGRSLEARVQEALDTSARLNAVFNGVRDAMFLIDRDGVVIEANHAAEELFHMPAESLIGSRAGRGVHPDDRAKFDQSYQALAANERIADLVLRVMDGRGQEQWVEATSANLLDDPAVNAMVITLRGINERLRKEQELARAEAQFRTAFEDAPIGMALSDGKGRVVEANAAMAAMLGYSPHELEQMSAQTIMHPDDWKANVAKMQELGGSGSKYQLESRYLHRDGHIVWGSLSISGVVVPGESQLLIAHVQDITESKAIAEQREYEARHDSLTGLTNRTHFLRAVERALRSPVDRARSAVLFIDLDRFKEVNDSMGHTVGDRLLCTVADRLRNVVRAPDVVGRLGGDEFTVLLTDVDDAVAAMAAAQRVAAVIREPIMINGIESIITPSIGVALAPPELEPQLAENLLRDADIAMYRAKEAGRARIELFAESVSPSDRKSRLQLVSDLHRAVDRREIVPFYQPVVDLATGAITKFEALARWRHPSNEIIMPADFIGLAEDSGLILPIGVLMMQQVCEQLACWNRERRRYGREPLSVSINLSPRQLEDSSIIAQVAETLTTHSVDPSWITFELTESAWMRDTVSTIATMRELRQLGIRLAIDDFGTGYSSLSYLKRFPVEALKIDRSFTDGLGQEPEDTAIVAAVISLAHALNLYAIAEGLETRQQLDELQRLGCDAAQGFLIGVPLPASDLADDPACSFDFAVLAR